MYGSTVSFTPGLLRSVVGDTALPPDDWTGLAKACLSAGKQAKACLSAMENRFYRAILGVGKL
jgi:hypothetical protein